MKGTLEWLAVNLLIIAIGVPGFAACMGLVWITTQLPAVAQPWAIGVAMLASVPIMAWSVPATFRAIDRLCRGHR